ncbi:MAG TPA: class E sortase [Acidimicrobiales bacterium]|nr:class E sortase [Acidimicrobiales bacterium]
MTSPGSPVLVEKDHELAVPAPLPAEKPGEGVEARPWWQSELAPITPRRVAVAVTAWLLVTVLGVVLVVYGVGPMLQRRSQRNLLADIRTEIRQAADEELSFDPNAEAGPDLEAPDPGAPVAVLEIGDLELLQVVVEGVGPQQTRRGPGHVPGTAGLGQPGNSGVVARRTAFGAPFGDLASLRRGDEIVVSTPQGQSLYEVRTVSSGEGMPDDVYGPTEDEDRLTLVSSDSSLPWAKGDAVVVVAEMEGQPYEPTSQAGRRSEADGREGDSSGVAPLVLAGLAYLLTVTVALALYRTSRPRSAYLLTAPPMLATVVLLAEAVARLLPAWS